MKTVVLCYNKTTKQIGLFYFEVTIMQGLSLTKHIGKRDRKDQTKNLLFVGKILSQRNIAFREMGRLNSHA